MLTWSTGWGTSGWPMKSRRAQKELREMVLSHSHTVAPLPLEVDRSELSGPEAYQRDLPGKLMIVRFILFHAVDLEEQVDHFEGQIVSLESILPWDCEQIC